MTMINSWNYFKKQESAQDENPSWQSENYVKTAYTLKAIKNILLPN